MTNKTDVFFYVVPYPTTLGEAKQLLYPDNAFLAKEFLRINNQALSSYSTQLRPGQVLYLPTGSCEANEHEMIKALANINHSILYEMTDTERQLLSSHPALVANIANNPEIFKNKHDPQREAVKYTGAIGGSLITAVQFEARSVTRTLEELQARFIHSYQVHGRLTPDYHAFKRAKFTQLDTALGRLSRTLTLGTSYQLAAAAHFKGSTKRQILHFKRYGVASGVQFFQQHINKLLSVSKSLKVGGGIFIALDGALTHEVISEACKDDSDNNCNYTRIVEGSGLAGRVAGGYIGGTLAYSACSIGLSLFTGGSSFILCSIVAGGGSLAGGYAIDSFAQHGAKKIYENKYRAIR